MESQTTHLSPDKEEPAEKPQEDQLEDTMDVDLFNSLLADATPRLIVTPLLLAINVLVFVLMLVSGVSPIDPSAEKLFDWGASYGPYILNGEWWRLVTAMFVHIGVVHIIFNMQALWSLGRVVERLYGNWTYLLMYLLGGIGGSIASLWWHADIISAGASGAIFGLAGGLAIGVYRGKLPMPQKVMQSLLTSTILFIGYNLVYGFINEGIDNAAHIGGLVVGAISGWFLLRELPRTDTEPRSHRLRGLALVAGLAALVSSTLILKSQDPLTEIIKAEELFFAGDTDQAMDILENVLAREPDNALGHFWQGNVFLEIDQYEEALSAFTEAITLDPELTEVYYHRGFAYIQLYRLEDALDDFTHSIDSYPDNPYGLYMRGLIYADLNQPELAIPDLEKAISLGLDEESHSYAEMALDELKR
jgi:membrane associated rhomboid family serine protease